MSRLRWKLLVAMLAVVALATGLSALLTRRVTHQELRRVLLSRPPRPDLGPLQRHWEARRNWSGVEAVLDRMPARVVLTTRERSLVAASREVRDGSIVVSPGDVVTVIRPGVQLVIRIAPVQVGDALVYVLPAGQPLERDSVASLDRGLLLTFSAATLAALLLTILLSRRITGPVERLSLAVETMARGGRPAHVEVKGRDEIAQLARSFNSMAGALGEQEELRRRMVGDVAHELRTPITNLRCELESIQDGLTAADPPRLASLHEEVLHLGRLVDDLQELAVAEAGGLRLQRERIDLGAIVSAATARFLTEAEKRGIALSVRSDPVIADADPTRIGQIVANLLGNALRHTPDGGHIDVVVRRADGEGLVTIADSGPGVPAAELERIFERFYRVDSARGRESGGAGLGLAIVRRLAELHGGRVWAESTPRGARFTFAIPASS